jgi:hypothetical protein
MHVHRFACTRERLPADVEAKLAEAQRLRSHDGDLTLVCTQPRILKVFEITGLTTVFKISGSVDEATSAG